ncbi:hypothetical protein D9M71_26110 [compost metagenome]
MKVNFALKCMMYYRMVLMILQSIQLSYMQGNHVIRMMGKRDYRKITKQEWLIATDIT